MNKVLMNTIRFVLLVIAQVLVINHIRLGGYVHPYIYLIFVMLLPINMSGWQLLLSGFGIGLTIDLFMGTLGMHAGATTLMAFCRPTIIRLVNPTYNSWGSPGSSATPCAWSPFITSPSSCSKASASILSDKHCSVSCSACLCPSSSSC